MLKKKYSTTLVKDGKANFFQVIKLLGTGPSAMGFHGGKKRLDSTLKTACECGHL